MFDCFLEREQERINVTIRTRQIYHSANGDRWLLAVDSDTDRVFVRHEPNLPSGGQIADIELGAFLIGAGSGPEKQELLRLIGTAGQGSESLGLAANALLKELRSLGTAAQSVSVSHHPSPGP